MQHLLPAGHLAPHFTVVVDQLSQVGRQWHAEADANDHELHEVGPTPVPADLLRNMVPWMHSLLGT